MASSVDTSDPKKQSEYLLSQLHNVAVERSAGYIVMAIMSVAWALLHIAKVLAEELRELRIVV